MTRVFPRTTLRAALPARLPWQWPAGAFGALVLLLTLAPGAAFAGRFGPPWQDQVTATSTIVYTQPDRTSAIVGPLPQNAIVVVVGEGPGADGTGWTQTPDGYIPSSDVSEDYQPWVASVTVPAVSIYAKPNTTEGIRRDAQQGDLLRVTGVVHGVDGDPSLWWATTEGYVGLRTITQGTSDWAKGWALPDAADAPNGWWGTFSSPANVRAAPTTDAPIVGMLGPGDRVKVLAQQNGQPVGGNAVWYRIDGGRYAGAWVHSSLIQRMAQPTPNTDTPADLPAGVTTWITVDRATNSLTLVQNGQAVFTTYVSLGEAGVETPDGLYSTAGKYRFDEMTSASVPDATHSYDLPNVPFVQYYKDGGYGIHGTYWHDLFGTVQSQGCINVTWTDGFYLFQQTQPTVPPDQLDQWATTAPATPVYIVN